MCTNKVMRVGYSHDAKAVYPGKLERLLTAAHDCDQAKKCVEELRRSVGWEKQIARK